MVNSKSLNALFVPFLLFISTNVSSQELLWGASPFQDSLWSIDTTSWSIVHRVAPSLSGFTITGINGLAYDQTSNETYVILKLSAVSGRVLGKISLPSGVCTQVGNLGDNFATLAFREDGQLFGVTGNGASVPETMYLIDKNNGDKTLAAALGAGADGEVISYNWDDNLFYHWSGNGTVIMEKILSVAPFTATNIPISGTPGGETFGSIYLGNNYFIQSNISTNLLRLNTAGVYGTVLSNNPDDLRGLVMPPVATFLAVGPQPAGTPVSWNFSGMVAYGGKIIYSWGDGTPDDTLSVPADFSHQYRCSGTYQSHAITMVDFGTDTLASATVVITAIDTDGDGVEDCRDICPGSDDSTCNIPAMSTWGVMILVVVLLIIGINALKFFPSFKELN